MFSFLYISPAPRFAWKLPKRVVVPRYWKPWNPKRRGQLAMSGPVIRFALVVTSLHGKLAISSWPPPPSSPLVVVSNRFPSWRFAVAAEPLSTDRRTRFACTWGEKKGATGTWQGTTSRYSDKLYRRFAMIRTGGIFADVTIARYIYRKYSSLDSLISRL